MESSYSLRPLKADDMFPMFAIIAKIGINEFKACFTSVSAKAEIMKNGGADATSVGIAVAFDIAGIVFANIGKCKEDIYLFLSGLSGMTKKEISELPMNVFMNMIIDVFKKEEFSDFFQAVSRLLH